jgi:hypothetical protein
MLYFSFDKQNHAYITTLPHTLDSTKFILNFFNEINTLENKGNLKYIITYYICIYIVTEHI